MNIDKKVLTIWKDCTWKVWNELDAQYATDDIDWMLNIDLEAILKELDEPDADSPFDGFP